ncbi:MAG TPA: TetR/AcrR family transcriptional regulator [Roseiflexaceae bacterium]|nr:TetR/AcrR family transcriptional regulator [Roseiflexaceae bacterium]
MKTTGRAGKESSQDRRIVRTHRLLAEALMELILEKGYEAVTVRDITERADVGYATFFRHYTDKEALLHEVVNVVLEDLVQLLQPQRASGDNIALGTELFRYVAGHSRLCLALLGSKGSPLLVRRIIAAGTANVLSENVQRPDAAIPIEVAAHHLIAATLHLIEWWLEHDMPYPPERMGLIYHELISRPTHEVAFEEGSKK